MDIDVAGYASLLSGADVTARALLATPPAIVLGFYIVAIGVPMLLEPALPDAIRASVGPLLDWSFWICAVMYAFALFCVAHKAARMSSSVTGSAIFTVTLALFVVSIVIQSWLGTPTLWAADNPLIFVFFAPVFCAVVSLGFAASALDTSEGGSGWPFKTATVWTAFAILFLPIGIWFLTRRVRKLLAQGD